MVRGAQEGRGRTAASGPISRLADPVMDRGAVAMAEPPAPRVSVVLPVFNEAGVIGRTFEAVREAAARFTDYEFIFVDDGSTDGTADTLAHRIAEAADERLRLIAPGTNRGKGAAVRVGFQQARGELLLFTDGDLAYSLDHLPQLVRALKRADVVIGSRPLAKGGDVNHRAAARALLGEGFNRLARLLTGLPYRDTQAGLKGFRGEVGRRILSRQRIPRYACDVEMLFLARRAGCTVAEIPARVAAHHEQKRSSVSLLRDPARMLADLLRIRLNALLRRYD